MAKELEARFSSYLGVSSRTGYDWTAPSVVTRIIMTSGFASVQVKKGFTRHGMGSLIIKVNIYIRKENESLPSGRILWRYNH